LKEVHQELLEFATSVAEVPELRAVLRNPELDPQTKAGLVGELLGEADELLRNFVRLTAEKGRIGDIEEIARAFDRLMAAEERRLDVELTTAFELKNLDVINLVSWGIRTVTLKKLECLKQARA